jgi:hypothetical protein
MIYDGESLLQGDRGGGCEMRSHIPPSPFRTSRQITRHKYIYVPGYVIIERSCASPMLVICLHFGKHSCKTARTYLHTYQWPPCPPCRYTEYCRMHFVHRRTSLPIAPAYKCPPRSSHPSPELNHAGVTPCPAFIALQHRHDVSLGE